MRAPLPFILLLAAAVTLSCSKEKLGTRAISILGPGVINDPRNKSLRFDVLKFGLEEFCKEMTARGAPLKLQDDQPVLGRFFATNCQSRVIDDDNRKSIVIQYSGVGYAWTNVSQRIGFSSSGVIEYAPDFQMHKGAMYVYFRPRNIDSVQFETKVVESALARTGAAVLNIDFNAMGLNIVRSQVERGFTVIRYSKSGETEFGLGFVPTGQKPFKPFQISGSDKRVLANDRTEVHTNQHDFVGGFEVKKGGKALYITATLDGAPAVDVLLIQKGVGDLMVNQYVANAGPTRLTAPPLLDDQLVAGQVFKRYVKVPKGVYYLLLDHSATIGRTAPAAVAGDDRAAKVDYVVQVGDAP